MNMSRQSRGTIITERINRFIYSVDHYNFVQQKSQFCVASIVRRDMESIQLICINLLFVPKVHITYIMRN